MTTKAREYALLAVLETHEAHGYALAEFFSASFGAYIGLNKATIYAALRRFEDKGWVVAREEAAGNYPDRRVLSLSQKGKTALEEIRKNTDPINFSAPDLAILMDSPDREKIIEILEEKAVRLEAFKKQAKTHQKAPALIYLQNMLEGEIKALEAVLQEI